MNIEAKTCPDHKKLMKLCEAKAKGFKKQVSFIEMKEMLLAYRSKLVVGK